MPAMIPLLQSPREKMDLGEGTCDKTSFRGFVGCQFGSVIQVMLCSRVHGIVGYNHQPLPRRPVER